VNLLEPPFKREQLFGDKRIPENKVRDKASHCLFCEHPHCSGELDIRGVMRRVMVGNVVGARRIVEAQQSTKETLETCEKRCIQNVQSGEPVAIREVFAYLQNR